MPIFRFLCAAVVLFLAGYMPLAYAQGQVPEGQVIAAQIMGVRISDAKNLTQFYAARDFKPLWIRGGEITRDADDVISVIADSWTHGLNPDTYHLALLKSFKQREFDGDTTLQADILISDAAAKLARDFSGMRLSPRVLKQDTRSWSRGVDAHTFLTIIQEGDDDAGDILQSFAPQSDEYGRLRRELKVLTEDLARHPETQGAELAYPGLVKPGMRHPVIVTVRKKLSAQATSSQDSDVYDMDLKKKVMEFQALHGLKADGLIGKRSFAAINQTRTQKLVKLIANLERRRWVMRPMPTRYIAVNIPAMELAAVEGGVVRFTMPVIIGRTQRPTVSFVDDIEGIRFNPSWYVPDTIKAQDYLPELQKDPNALAKKGITFRVKDENGSHRVEPKDIDWSKITEGDLKSIQMKQDPGEDNVLGQIRVLMPNGYDIYLHDTSAPELFAKDDRALSSGCVRLSEPRKIANFILSKNSQWSDDKLEGYLAKKRTVEVPVAQPLPVYLFYFTAWVNAEDDVIIADDIYGEDRALVAALAQAGMVPFQMPRFQ